MKNIQAPQLEGVSFVTNAAGEQIAVLIDLKQHGELWEDFYDATLVRARADEPRESFEEVRKMLGLETEA
jgi:hypothetical protein